MTFKSICKIIIGIIITATGVACSVIFLKMFLALLLGVIGPLLILVGLVMIAIAKE